MLTTTPCKDCALENQANEVLNHWLRTYPLPHNEFLHVSANDQGEVTLWGMVDNRYPLADVLYALSTLAGVHTVTNGVTHLFAGQPIKL